MSLPHALEWESSLTLLLAWLPGTRDFAQEQLDLVGSQAGRESRAGSGNRRPHARIGLVGVAGVGARGRRQSRGSD